MKDNHIQLHTENEYVEIDPCVLACKILANHKSGVCLIIHDKNRKHNHSTHWFDNLDSREVLNSAIDITERAQINDYSWSFYVLKAYNEETGNVMCQDTTESFNKSVSNAKRLKDLL